MSHEINGKLIKVLDIKSGTGSKGEWSTIDFIIETKDQYPKTVCFQAWNKQVDAISNCTLGSEIKVHFNIESREYQGKYYTTLKVWKFEANSTNSNHAQVSEHPVKTDIHDDNDSGLPF